MKITSSTKCAKCRYLIICDLFTSHECKGNDYKFYKFASKEELEEREKNTRVLN